MIEVEIDDPAWTSSLPEAEGVALAAAAAVLDAEDREGALVVLLTDDAALHDLNHRFRGKDGPTNVLSFPAAPSAGYLGDIALAFETCAREATEQGKTLTQHLQHLTAHGVLHLLGYDHETDREAEAMEAKERAILSGLGIPDPYG